MQECLVLFQDLVDKLDGRLGERSKEARVWVTRPRPKPFMIKMLDPEIDAK